MNRKWCSDCQGEREGWHIHGDLLEQLPWEALLMLLRAEQAAPPMPPPTPSNPPLHADEAGSQC